MAQQDETNRDHPASSAPMVPALEANLFRAEAHGASVRVAFGQQWTGGGQIVWFSTVALDLSNATQLRDVLDTVIAQAEEQLAQRR